MTRSANPTEAPGDGGFLSPKPDAKPVDHCFRCGKETPAGVGLCEEHNRGHIAGPSPTQMHATIFGGIALGVIGLFVLAGLVITTSGPFGSTITSATGGPDGSVSLVFTVTNEGDEEGVADCRVTRDGVPRPEDLAFRTVALTGGETVSIERELDPPEVAPAYDLETMTVECV